MNSELDSLRKMYDNPKLRGLFTKLCRRTSTSFGLLEAVLFSRAVDFFNRYSYFVRCVDRKGVIVDVGSGKIGIGAFIDPTYTISLDIVPSLVKSASGHRIVASAGNLPFRLSSVSTIVSGDCVEHLPPKVRKSFFEESKQVASEVMLHTPNGTYAATVDEWFESTHQRLFGKPADIHVQHAEFGHPTINDLIDAFGSNTWFLGTQNWRVNYILFVLQRVPFVGWLTGLLFLALLKGHYNRPPYYGIFVWWSKDYLRVGNWV